MKQVTVVREEGVMESPSPRKAWIETARSETKSGRNCVAFPPEGVD